MKLKGLSDQAVQKVARVVKGQAKSYKWDGELYTNGPALGGESEIGTLREWAESLRDMDWYDDYLVAMDLDPSEFSYEDWILSLTEDPDNLYVASDEEIAEYPRLI